MIPYEQFIKNNKDLTKLKENINSSKTTSDDITIAQHKPEAPIIMQSSQDTVINNDTVMYANDPDNVSEINNADDIKQDKEETLNDSSDNKIF